MIAKHNNISKPPEYLLHRKIDPNIQKLPREAQEAELWLVKWAAFVADAGPGRIRRWLNDGKVAFTKIGGRLYVDRESFIEYLEKMARDSA